ncbi:uncharacterized protein LOC132792482 [Drosophila nasuta]|uniref:Uncharacterized protein LOC117571236 isoform X1 n=1 Tax=Drosophila albomicans TaxID=7291 RepID=A0A6P8X8K7_DROAB|nr:uncharacterized protein LOC117571236 isoform X2 [Drosophila albomicans]XP_034109180.1 uncharacterized protein LOC117571236 isoform X1 [Drosophila albomicans]XP_060657867.1 uncharacterized protein LOC132792482 [Drosophila nasuta]
MEDRKFDISQNLCESSCFKSAKQLLENSDKKAGFEEFIYLFIFVFCIILTLVFNTIFNRKENTEALNTKDELIEKLKESLELSEDNRKLWDKNQLEMTTKIDNLMAQLATANEKMIDKDNEIAMLTSTISRNEKEINGAIEIIIGLNRHISGDC